MFSSVYAIRSWGVRNTSASRSSMDWKPDIFIISRTSSASLLSATCANGDMREPRRTSVASGVGAESSTATFNDFFLEDMLALVLWRLSNILGERSLAAMKLVGPDAAGDDAAGADEEEDGLAAAPDVSTF